MAKKSRGTKRQKLSRGQQIIDPSAEVRAEDHKAAGKAEESTHVVEEAAEDADEVEQDAVDDDDDQPSNVTTPTDEQVPTERFVSDGRYRNKQRCLVLCSRGVTARYRHLLEDLRTLMPHHKKESKLDAGDIAIGQAVNDIAEMRSCNSVLFLETRKRQDAYMWMAKVGGPSVRFHVTNVHTMDELRLTGNCMKGSRPILSFDDSFEKVGHLQLLKELFVDIFGTPRGHPKCKPFVDRIMCFYYADKKVRNVGAYYIFSTIFVYDSINDERMSDHLLGMRATTILCDYDGMRLVEKFSSPLVVFLRLKLKVFCFVAMPFFRFG